MEYAKTFNTGGSQAVRLPKSCQFQERELIAKRIGNVVLLMPKDDPWKGMLQSFDLFTEDFLADGIEDMPVQERNPL